MEQHDVLLGLAIKLDQRGSTDPVRGTLLLPFNSAVGSRYYLGRPLPPVLQHGHLPFFVAPQTSSTSPSDCRPTRRRCSGGATTGCMWRQGAPSYSGPCSRWQSGLRRGLANTGTLTYVGGAWSSNTSSGH